MCFLLKAIVLLYHLKGNFIAVQRTCASRQLVVSVVYARLHVDIYYYDQRTNSIRYDHEEMQFTKKNSGRYQSYFTSEGAYFGIMSPSKGVGVKRPAGHSRQNFSESF